MKAHNILIFILAGLMGGMAIFWAGCAFPGDVSLEWSLYKPGECDDCTSFDLYRRHNIIVHDIPITQTEITVALPEVFIHCEDYTLTAKNGWQRSGKSDIARVCPDDGPIITQISQLK